MLREYPALVVASVISTPEGGLGMATPSRTAAITLESPALEVMTDFTQIPPATIEQEALASTANEYMRRRNVRSLIVTGAHGVAGIITTTDVLGEKPVKFALEYGVKRDEVRVSDIMTPRALLEFLAFEDVRQARVGHLVASFRKVGRQHFLVSDRVPASGEFSIGRTETRVRGIISLAQIGRQLGIDIPLATFAHTFAEIESALSH